uniref:Secreted protein n=1 Tax=Ixodes ricinus TaxID=34613 RepID=V5HAB8_IXORI
MTYISAWISASFQPVLAGSCTNLGFPTAYGIFECAGSNIDLCADLDSTKLTNMNKLIDCTVNGLASLGYNGHLFSNLEPLIADIFTNLVNVSVAANSLETLAHYCDSHQDESFCQVPALANAECSTPVQVNVPQDAKKDVTFGA